MRQIIPKPGVSLAMPQHLLRLAPAFILTVAALLVNGLWFQSANGVTVDEPAYLNFYRTWASSGGYDGFESGGTAPLPVLISYGFADLTLRWTSGVDAQAVGMDVRHILIARRYALLWCSVLMAATVVGFVYARTHSEMAAGAAGILVACSPTVIAHSAVAGTDGLFGPIFLLAAVAVGHYAAVPTRLRWAIMAVVVTVAMLTKYSAILLFPVVLGADLMFLWNRTAGGLVRKITLTVAAAGVRQFGFVAVVFFGCWAATGFAAGSMPLCDHPAAECPEGSVWRRTLGRSEAADAVIDRAHTTRVPAVLRGLIVQIRMGPWYGQNYPPYLLGHYYKGGHRGYYVVSAAVKSTPPRTCPPSTSRRFAPPSSVSSTGR